EDMTIRKLAPKTQHDYVQRIKNFAAFLGRSPDKASFEDVRRYQLHLTASGVGVRLHRIRHYGLFAKGACADNIATAVDPGKPACPCCGGRMIIIEVFARGATPRHWPTHPATVIRIDTS